ncbi:hypothetical protein [Natronorubrum tibetense]|uniref:Uncharacterized protein n=1 Tax=Natronorubrum tibetense GA33 TaxID=1114856 RepID=L9VQ46_9EURY|nr:hypothetical protein [Natronorubrum tibetense]ELY39289.1 hypothetical protein C496_15567 [Natronorubrum tibetense GA33]
MNFIYLNKVAQHENRLGSSTEWSTSGDHWSEVTRQAIREKIEALDVMDELTPGIELFDAGTPAVPGGGDVSVRNPDAESCATSFRNAYDGPDELDESPLERS